MFRKFVAAGIVASVSLFGVGAASAAEVVKLGFIQPIKSVLGQKAVKAVEVAAEMINERGGILGGKTVELVVYDDNFTPADGVAATQRLISQDDIKLMAGGLSSTVALAMIPVLEAENALFIATVPKHSDVTESGYGNVFRLNSTTPMDAVVFNAFVKDQIKPKKIAFVGENNDFGRQNLDELEKLADEIGGAVVYDSFYDTKQNDFNAMVTDAKASDADTLFLAGANVEQYANIVRSASELGYSPEHVVLSAGTLNSDFVRLAEEGAEGAVSVDIYSNGYDNPLNNTFVEKFKEKTGAAPEKVEALNFEGIWLLAHAIDKAGTMEDTDAIAEALRSNTWETLRGKVTFDEKGQAQGEAFVVTVTDGKIVRQ